MRVFTEKYKTTIIHFVFGDSILICTALFVLGSFFSHLTARLDIGIHVLVINSTAIKFIEKLAFK